MSPDRACRSLWAKTERDGDRWHSLPAHLLDVAAAGEALWKRLPSRSRSVAEKHFQDTEVARRVVTFLAASHDVGKANRYFQKKDKRQERRLAAAGFELSPLPEPATHGQASGAYLKPWLITRFGWSGFSAESVALAVGGHHGVFFSRDCRQSTLQFDGTLIVTDPDRLREAVRTGIGPQKAFGFGLLSLAPIK